MGKQSAPKMIVAIAAERSTDPSHGFGSGGGTITVSSVALSAPPAEFVLDTLVEVSSFGRIA